MSTSTSPVDEVVNLLRELRLPHMRRTAADLLATAKAQRWDPAEAVKALLAEELAGRQASSINSRRKAAGFPTPKTFDAWDETVSSIPATAETAEALYRVVDAAYEKRSIALSSNLHPAGFGELMPKTIANATVDRLMHHAHVGLTAGDSIRLTQATNGKGGDTTDQLSYGQNTWPPPGSSAGHGWTVPLSATGQIPLALDIVPRPIPVGDCSNRHGTSLGFAGWPIRACSGNDSPRGAPAAARRPVQPRGTDARRPRHFCRDLLGVGFGIRFVGAWSRASSARLHAACVWC